MIERFTPDALPENMFSVRQVPWHGLGTIVQHHLAAAEALQEAKLDWTVNLRPVFDADMKRIEGFHAPTRSSDGKALGIVGSRYHAIQNVECFDWMDTLIGDSSAKYETAGDLFGGKCVWMLARLPQTVKVAGDDITPYFLATNRHDGTGSLTLAMTPVRVVCQNTLIMALGSASRTMRIRHTKNYEDKLATARTALGMTMTYYKSFIEVANDLAIQAFSKAAFEKLVANLIPVPDVPGRGRTTALDQQGRLMQAYAAPDIENIRGTKWGALNAVADYADHSRKLVGDAETRTSNAYLRTFEDTTLKDRALELLRA